MDSRVVTTHVPRHLAKRLDGFAEKLGRSRSRLMVQALSEWVARQDAANGVDPTNENPVIRAATSLKTLREFLTLDDITWQELRDPRSY